MKARFKFFILYYAYWLCIFIFAKVIFLLYHITLTSKLDFGSILGIFTHGFMLDLSAGSYVIVFPLLVLLLTSYTSGKTAAWIINAYTLPALLLVIIAVLVDLEIYKYWGIRLDYTALRFVGKPREVFASTSWYMIIILFLALALLLTLLFFIHKRYVVKCLAQSDKPRWKGLIIFLLLFPPVFLAIRGGTGVAPISVSRVYFHSEPYPNHAAINVLWNIGNSMLEKKDQPNPFRYLSEDTARQYINTLFAEEETGLKLLNTSRPNIILVIIESFTAKLIEPLGGLPDVTPEFNKLCNESVFFTNFYANDSRTDKSLVSILSGYPALGRISIIKFPNKTQKLGIISRNLANAGYQTSFYYGGDVDFGNIRSYLVNGMFQKIVEVNDFDKSLPTGRWGVHDQYTFQRLAEDCDASDEPFFKVLLTLSNHEPFDVPVKPKFVNRTVDDHVSNSAYYTDSCIGDFIREAKQSLWWQNTLIIMLADHGTIFPGNTVVYYPEKYKIPMIWTGGAIRSDTVISTFMSQSDLARTLLNQLEIHTSDYPLSKDIFRAKHPFAFYEFNNGFGMMSDSGNYVFDNDLQRLVLQNGTVTEEFIRSGKAIQQETYELFLKN